MLGNSYRSKLAVLVLAGLLCAGANAQERKAYKYVDEKGNVVYSQTPPAGKDARKLDISPANSGRVGTTTPGGAYDDPRRYSSDQDRVNERRREMERKREEANQKRLAELEAECNRNRGADCKNPETLRLIEASRIPRSRY
jgi:hypothetical protein